jgi:copper oxidase (laccase) domain-containing protein
MNQDFTFVVHNGIELLVYIPWWEQGLVHGMTTRDLAFRRTELRESAASLCEAVGVSELALAQQCHGAGVLDLRKATSVSSIKHQHEDLLCRTEADVVLAPQTAHAHQNSLAYGVMTADCVPIIVRGHDGYALIHAGWRGLACGVVAAGLNALGVPIEAIVLAAAGGDRYEVGLEVIEAIGETAVYTVSSNSGGKYLLDTAQTAVRQLTKLAPSLRCHSASICTIEDLRFHSFRRDKERAGRCITFIVPGSELSGGTR